MRDGIPEHYLDINAPAFVYDPYPVLADLRERLPIFYDPVWSKVFFARYDDIAALLRERRLGRAILHVLSRDERHDRGDGDRPRGHPSPSP